VRWFLTIGIKLGKKHSTVFGEVTHTKPIYKVTPGFVETVEMILNKRLGYSRNYDGN